MAMFPCDFCGRRYRGKQNTLYPAAVHYAAEYRVKARICTDCWAVYEQMITSLDVINRPALEANACAFCHAPDAGIGVFITYYCDGKEREDCYFRVCGAHLRDDVGPALFPPVETLFQSLEPIFRSSMTDR